MAAVAQGHEVVVVQPHMRRVRYLGNVVSISRHRDSLGLKAIHAQRIASQVHCPQLAPASIIAAFGGRTSVLILGLVVGALVSLAPPALYPFGASGLVAVAESAGPALRVACGYVIVGVCLHCFIA